MFHPASAAVAGLLFLGLAPPGGHTPMLATSVAQSLPIQQGQSYTEARILLLAAGWNRSHAVRQEECSAGIVDRRCHLFPEIASCSHTGLGLCRFDWRSPQGRHYAVITSGGDSGGDPGVVERWFPLP